MYLKSRALIIVSEMNEMLYNCNENATFNFNRYIFMKITLFRYDRNVLLLQL